MRAGIADYRMGNLASLSKALERVGFETFVSEVPGDLSESDVLFLPGVGNFSSGMRNLDAAGLGDFIREWASSDRPLVGICLGMQLLFEHSEEGDTSGLGILAGTVERITGTLKVPHMGFNDVIEANTEAFDSLVGQYFYFVHSYVCRPKDRSRVAITSYGDDFVSATMAGRVLAFQFHPEKSGAAGLSLLTHIAEVMS